MKKLFKILIGICAFVTLSMAAVNINTASKEELMSLDGIGIAKAEAIIKYREINKFKSIDELKNIKGIGNKRFENIKDSVSVSGETVVQPKKTKSKTTPKTNEPNKTIK